MYSEALDELQKSLDNPTWDARGLNYPIMAMAHFRLGHIDEANDALEKARQATDGFDKSMFNSTRNSVPLTDSLNWLQFLWYYDEACKLINGSAAPVSVHRLVVHARALAAIGKNELAAQEIRRVAELAPTDPQIRFACFKFHVEQKHLDEAAAELTAVMAAQP